MTITCRHFALLLASLAILGCTSLDSLPRGRRTAWRVSAGDPQTHVPAARELDSESNREPVIEPQANTPPPGENVTPDQAESKSAPISPTEMLVEILCGLLNQIDTFPERYAVKEFAEGLGWTRLSAAEARLQDAKDGYVGTYDDYVVALGSDGTNDVFSLSVSEFDREEFERLLAEVHVLLKPWANDEQIGTATEFFHIHHKQDKLGVLTITTSTSSTTDNLCTVGFISARKAAQGRQERQLAQTTKSTKVLLQFFTEMLEEASRCESWESPVKRMAHANDWRRIEDPMAVNTYVVVRDQQTLAVGDLDNNKMFTITQPVGFDLDKLLAELDANFTFSKRSERRVQRGTILLLRLADQRGLVTVTKESELTPLGGGIWVSFRARLLSKRVSGRHTRRFLEQPEPLQTRHDQ